MYAVLVAMAPVPEETQFVSQEVGRILATVDRLVVVRKTPPGGEPGHHRCLETATNAGVGQLLFRVIGPHRRVYLEVVDSLDAEIDELEDNIDPDGRACAFGVASPTSGTTRSMRGEPSAQRVARSGEFATRPSTSINYTLFPDEVECEFADTYETLPRAGRSSTSPGDLLAEARATTTSPPIAESQNEVAKKLTVIASLVLVPSLIVGFYGQNFVSEFDKGYWAIGVSAGLILVLDGDPARDLPLASLDLSGARRRLDGHRSPVFLFALRPSCVTDAPAVPDEEVWESAPSRPAARRAAGRARSSPDPLTREPEALRQPPDVRVHDDALRMPEFGGDDVGRLPRDARQPYEASSLLGTTPSKSSMSICIVPRIAFAFCRKNPVA